MTSKLEHRSGYATEILLKKQKKKEKQKTEATRSRETNPCRQQVLHGVGRQRTDGFAESLRIRAAVRGGGGGGDTRRLLLLDVKRRFVGHPPKRRSALAEERLGGTFEPLEFASGSSIRYGPISIIFSTEVKVT